MDGCTLQTEVEKEKAIKCLEAAIRRRTSEVKKIYTCIVACNAIIYRSNESSMLVLKGSELGAMCKGPRRTALGSNPYPPRKWTFSDESRRHNCRGASHERVLRERCIRETCRCKDH